MTLKGLIAPARIAMVGASQTTAEANSLPALVASLGLSAVAARMIAASALAAALIIFAFAYAPFRQGDYILSVGLLPNVPGTWEFYEYRHLFYSFHVADASLGVGAPIFFEPSAVKFVDFEMTADCNEAATPAAM